MQYKECHHCGAHLDHGEVCDCHKQQEDAPDAAETPSHGNAGDADVSVSNSEMDVNHCLQLREIRQQTGAMAKDAALVVRDLFPKFNRQLFAQCEAWEKYGVIIHPAGLEAFCRAYGVELEPETAPPEISVEDSAPKPPRKKANRKLSRRLTFRMTDSDFAKVKRRVQKDGFPSVQAWLYFQFTQLLKGDER